MSVRQYIGARYVPVFSDPIQWDSTNSYEPLTVVMNQGTSYVSKQSVPIGIEITNETYWLRWADYNAQLEEYIRQVQQYSGQITALNDALPITDFDDNNTVKDTINALDTAIDARFDIIEADDWVTTDRIADNAVTADKIADNAKTYINVLEHGIKNDGETDNFEALQTLFDNVSDSGGGTLYFPTGQYNVSNTVVIDDNINIIGDGASTLIYGDGVLFHHFGTVLAIIGNNVTVKDIAGSYYLYDTNFKTTGANFGFLGIGSYTRESLEAYILQESTELIQRNTSNILIENFYSDSHYPLQTESANIKDVTYSNIYAPNGTVQFQSNSAYNSGRFTANNIYCAFFSVKDNGDNAFNANISNVICCAFYCNSEAANISNVYIDYYTNNPVAKWILAETYNLTYLAYFVNCSVTNVSLNMHNAVVAIRKLFVAASTTNAYISNVQFFGCSDSVNLNVDFQEANNQIIWGTNIDFSKCDSTQAHHISGLFSNCKFGSLNASYSNIRTDSYTRNLSNLMGADSSLTNPIRFSSDYNNYAFLYEWHVEFFFAIGFTAVTLSSLTPDKRFGVFNADHIRPTRNHHFAGYVLDSSDNTYKPALFTVKSDGIYLTVSPTTHVSRVCVGGTYSLV